MSFYQWMYPVTKISLVGFDLGELHNTTEIETPSIQSLHIFVDQVVVLSIDIIIFCAKRVANYLKTAYFDFIHFF